MSVILFFQDQFFHCLIFFRYMAGFYSTIFGIGVIWGFFYLKHAAINVFHMAFDRMELLAQIACANSTLEYNTKLFSKLLHQYPEYLHFEFLVLSNIWNYLSFLFQPLWQVDSEQCYTVIFNLHSLVKVEHIFLFCQPLKYLFL